VRVLFATTNQGKLRELRELVGGDLEVVSLADLPPQPEVDEDQPTLEGNAEKKARVYAKASGLPTLADDSGLCVDALEGRPGVQSARYGADDAGRIRRLLVELAPVPEGKRAAAFRCALCLVVPGGEARVEVGECAGEILFAPRGENGFGYDPVFLVPARGKTMAELTSAEKSALSHRGQAFRKMRSHLSALAKKSAV
jgi:XTP/dITP diphosphohydrolase